MGVYENFPTHGFFPSLFQNVYSVPVYQKRILEKPKKQTELYRVHLRNARGSTDKICEIPFIDLSRLTCSST